MTKILLLGSQHGNELLGEELYKYIKARRQELLPYVTYKVANPKAKKANVRFIDADMNRSFDGSNQTYEQRQAKRVIKYIEAGKFDLVLDLHTCFSIMPPCMIVPHNYTGRMRFMSASHVSKVVTLGSEILNTTLVGNCPNCVTKEVNRDSVNMTFLDALCDDITRYIDADTGVAIKTVYKAEALAKTELSLRETNKLKNFVKSDHGFYPILVGQNPYKKMIGYKYLGFKAYSAERTKL